jgi:hypothetical protein
VSLLAGFAIISLVIAVWPLRRGDVQHAPSHSRVRRADGAGASTSRIQAAVLRESITACNRRNRDWPRDECGHRDRFRSTLFGVTPIDPITHVSVVALLAVT